MSKQTEALKLALEALEESLGYVEDEAETAQRLYGQYPTRKARIQGLKDDARKHMDAITAICEALAEQPAQQQEPVAWRDHVEQRLLTWRQSFVNKSGDQLALDDFMDKRSLDDLIDFVCSEYTSPPASKPWVGLTDEDIQEVRENCGITHHAIKTIEAKLKEKNT